MSDKKTIQSNPPPPEKSTEATLQQHYTTPNYGKETQTGGSSSEQHTHQPMPPITDGFHTEKEHQQLLLDEEALRETLEEQARAEKESGYASIFAATNPKFISHSVSYLQELNLNLQERLNHSVRRFSVNEVPEPNKKVMGSDQQINHQLTEETLGNNVETSEHNTKLLVPEAPQSQDTNHASISSYPIAQDRWSSDQHIELVNITGDLSEGMFTRSMVAKLTAA
ncbi:hypothetical protein Tco_0002412 [Tanacetum coccineum]